MAARATHTDYTVRSSRYIFALLKSMFAKVSFLLDFLPDWVFQGFLRGSVRPARNSTARRLFQRIAELDGMDLKTRVRVLKSLVRVRVRGVYSESLDNFEISELQFAVSPHDLVHNIVEVKRSKRALNLARVGFPFHRNVSYDAVSPVGTE